MAERESRHSRCLSQIRALTAENELLRVRVALLEAEPRAREWSAGEAPNPAVAGQRTTEVLPFVDDRAARMGTAVASASAAKGGEQGSSLEFLQRRAGLADFVHDGARRDAMVIEMRKGGQSYSAEEAGLIAQATDLLSSLAKGAGKTRPIKLHAKTVDMAQTKHDKSSGMVVGEVKLLVPASSEEIIAFLMHLDSKFYQSKFNAKLNVCSEILEVKNSHCTITFNEMKTAPFVNRTFLGAVLWQKISDVPLTYIWVTAPIECHDKISTKQEAHAVRAEVRRVVRLTSTADGHTRVEYACSLDLKGRVPQWLTNDVALPVLLNVPYAPNVLCTGQASSQVHGEGRRAPRPPAR